jgi:rubrerythrin
MNIEEAIKTSIEYEIRVRDVYTEAMDEADNPVGKRLYKLLADEENRHVLYLEHKLVDWKKSGRLSADDLDTALPDPEVIEKEVGRLQSQLQVKDKGREIELLRKAFDVENETSAFYERLVSELPEEGRKFYRRFLEIEAGHIGLVQAEMDAIEGTGFWFDMAEFSPEKG